MIFCTDYFLIDEDEDVGPAVGDMIEVKQYHSFFLCEVVGFTEGKHSVRWEDDDDQQALDLWVETWRYQGDSTTHGGDDRSDDDFEED